MDISRLSKDFNLFHHKTHADRYGSCFLAKNVYNISKFLKEVRQLERILRDLLAYQLKENPLPWTVDGSSVFEVRASNEVVIFASTDRAVANSLVSLAEEVHEMTQTHWGV